MNERPATSSRIVVRRRVVRGGGDPSRGIFTPKARRRGLAILAIALVSLVLLSELQSLNVLRAEPVIGADYVEISEYVSARHRPGELVITALPAPVFLTLGSGADIVFLPSPLERERAQRYTRILEDGRFVDYWIGADSVVDVAGLCTTLLTSPGVWLVLDKARLNADWAYKGPMAEVILGLTYLQYRGADDAQVRRLAPAPSRHPAAEQICAAALAGLPLPDVAVPTETPND
jgi:hypothetical protein